MDYNKRTELITKIKQQNLPLPSGNQPHPIVSIEDFFIGNDDVGSIGCNLLDHPGVEVFYEAFASIREKPSVQEVFVEINEIDEASEGVWPFSDRVYVLTSASREEVANWVSELEPDEIEEGYAYGPPPSAIQLEPGMRVYGIWWD
jgi:hypothetical protein